MGLALFSPQDRAIEPIEGRGVKYFVSSRGWVDMYVPYGP